MLRLILALAFLAPLAQAVDPKGKPKGDTSADVDKDCPPAGSAKCPAQGGCGDRPSHNLAYSLRFGHADYDWKSGTIYNQGNHPKEDHGSWDWNAAPPFDDYDAWCLEDCRAVRSDPKKEGEPCVEPMPKVKAPPERPGCPAKIRCFMGDPEGGIDWKKYPRCGSGCTGKECEPKTGCPENKPWKNSRDGKCYSTGASCKSASSGKSATCRKCP